MLIVKKNDTIKAGQPSLIEGLNLLLELKCVDIVINSLDKDGTINKTLKLVTPKPDYFYSGGAAATMAESAICKSRGIRVLEDLHSVQLESATRRQTRVHDNLKVLCAVCNTEIPHICYWCRTKE